MWPTVIKVTVAKNFYFIFHIFDAIKSLNSFIPQCQLKIGKNPKIFRLRSLSVKEFKNKILLPGTTYIYST